MLESYFLLLNQEYEYNTEVNSLTLLNFRSNHGRYFRPCILKVHAVYLKSELYDIKKYLIQFDP